MGVQNKKRSLLFVGLRKFTCGEKSPSENKESLAAGKWAVNYKIDEA